MLGSIDILAIDDGVAPDGACRMIYDKRRIEGTICIRPSSDPMAKACDTKPVPRSDIIGVLSCETSTGGPLGSLAITALEDVEIFAPCTLQIGPLRFSGRTVFYPFQGEPQHLCHVR